MADNKETQDLHRFAGALTTSIYRFSDGTNFTEMLSEALRVFPDGQKAFEDFGQIGAEATVATIEDKAARAAAFRGAIGSPLPELDAYDLTAFTQGLASIYEFIRRKTAGKVAADILARLEDGDTVEELRAEYCG